jgi:hypothetical protein
MVKLKQKIKAYVEKLSCDDFINDFDMCVTPFVKDIDFSLYDPQDLSITLFMKQNNLLIKPLDEKAVSNK